MSRDPSTAELVGAVLSWLVGRWEGERGGGREGEGGCSVEQSLVGLQVVVLGDDLS